MQLLLSLLGAGADNPAGDRFTAGRAHWCTSLYSCHQKRWRPEANRKRRKWRGKERSNCYFVLVNSQFEKGRDLGRLSDIFCQFHFWKCSSRPWNINLRNYGRNGRILMVWHGHFRTFSELIELLCQILILTRAKLEITSSWKPLVTECDATQDNFGRKISQVDEINYDRTKYVWTCGKLQRNSTTKYPFSASWAFFGSCMIIQFSQKCVTSSTERAEWTGIGTEV